MCSLPRCHMSIPVACLLRCLLCCVLRAAKCRSGILFPPASRLFFYTRTIYLFISIITLPAILTCEKTCMPERCGFDVLSDTSILLCFRGYQRGGDALVLSRNLTFDGEHVSLYTVEELPHEH